MPELESTCDLRSKTLFSTRSFTPEHRFAFDSRVPASSCVQYSRTAKLLVIESLRCSSQTNMSGIVFWTANRPKIPFLASICCSDARNMSVLCPLGLSGSTNMRGIWGGPASGFICIPAGAGPWDIRADKIPTSEFQIRIRYRPFCYPIKPGCPPGQ